MKKMKKCRAAMLTLLFAVCSLSGEVIQPRIAVLDMVNPDVLGQQKYLNFTSQTIKLGGNCTLDNVDRAAMNSVMQGYVRMIDAQDITRTNAVNREMLLRDNEFNRAKTLALYRTMVKGEARPLLLGASYLTASLAKHPETVSCLDGAIMANAMAKLQAEANFPQDFMLKLAQATGATHLIYGTVADIHTKSKSFKGYGIETQSVVYELDVLIKLADLVNQRIVYSKVYTGTLQERYLSAGGLELDGNKYQTLMKSAMEQAGEDICNRFQTQEGNFKVTAVPAAGRQVKSVPAPKAPEQAAKPAATPAAIPVSKPNGDAVIIQHATPALTPDGLPAVPPPPAAVPVSNTGSTVVVVNSGCLPGVTAVSVESAAKPAPKQNNQK